MYGSSAQDPYLLSGFQTAVPFISTNGLTVSSATINPALKTLVYIAAGQSTRTNNVPTTYIPSNSTVIDNFNIYDGALYNVGGALLGCGWYPNTSTGVGNVLPRVADLFISSGMFNRVILVPIALPSTPAAAWSSGVLSNRVAVAMARLSARGITSSTPGVTFTFDWGLGETDGALGTTAPNFTSQTNAVFTAAIAAGYSGPFFVPTETWSSGTASPVIQGAQQAMWNGTTIFDGGNLDTLNNTYRSDTTNFNDTGSIAASVLIFNAMSLRLGTWTTAFSQTLNFDSAGWSTYTMKQSIGTSLLSVSGTSSIRVTVAASSTGSMSFDGLYVGDQNAAGEGPDAVSLTRLLFTLGTGTLSLSAAQTAFSNVLPFSWDATKTKIFSVHFNSTSAINGRNTVTGALNYFKGPGVDEAATANVNGATYSASGSALRLVSKVEVLVT